MKNFENIILLDNIRSSENVGSIFRTADAFGISKIILCGITPLPVDKFKRENKKIAKSALGAEKTMVWGSAKSAQKTLLKLKKENYFLVAVEQAENSVDYRKIRPKNKNCFIFGNEIDGISPKILSVCDKVAEIPMRGTKESLNVSVAFGVAISRILNN